jgi:hypothetical protein
MPAWASSVHDRDLIPAALKADWYARGVGGATEHAKEGTACEINKIPADVDPTKGQHQGKLV